MKPVKVTTEVQQANVLNDLKNWQDEQKKKAGVKRSEFSFAEDELPKVAESPVPPSQGNVSSGQVVLMER